MIYDCITDINYVASLNNQPERKRKSLLTSVYFKKIIPFGKATTLIEQPHREREREREREDSNIK